MCFDICTVPLLIILIVIILIYIRHVHSQCDPEANEQTFLEKRAVQFNYMYSCKVCKGTVQRAATMSGSNTPTSSITSPRDQSEETFDINKASTSWLSGGSADNSFEADDESRNSNLNIGMGRGKPMSALAGKRKRMGLMASRGGGNGRPGWKPPDYSPTSGGSSPPMTLSDRKRANEVRRRGRQPKIRGMVGLQVCEF